MDTSNDDVHKLRSPLLSGVIWRIRVSIYSFVAMLKSSKNRMDQIDQNHRLVEVCTMQYEQTQRIE